MSSSLYASSSVRSDTGRSSVVPQASGLSSTSSACMVAWGASMLHKREGRVSRTGVLDLILIRHWLLEFWFGCGKIIEERRRDLLDTGCIKISECWMSHANIVVHVVFPKRWLQLAGGTNIAELIGDRDICIDLAIQVFIDIRKPHIQRHCGQLEMVLKESPRLDPKLSVRLPHPQKPQGVGISS